MARIRFTDIPRYRLKHKPTGMYYQPSRKIRDRASRHYLKTNLSLKGKIYHDYPSPGYVAGGFVSHLPHHVDRSRYERNSSVSPENIWQPFVPSDWEVQEVKMVRYNG